MPITGLQLITVTGKYLKLDGTPASGTVSFESSTVITNKSANEIIYPVTFTSTLDSSGSFSVVIPSTDDPDIEPQGWTYKVTERLIAVGTRSYTISLFSGVVVIYDANTTYDDTTTYGDQAAATIDLADIPHN